LLAKAVDMVDAEAVEAVVVVEMPLAMCVVWVVT
jgi:hypothetical protein